MDVDAGSLQEAPQEEAPASSLTFPQNPEVLYTVQHEYTCVQPGSSPCPHSNCLKGAKWSPDGACLLTASEDAWMRVYDLPHDCMTAPAALLLPPPPPSLAPHPHPHPATPSHPSHPASPPQPWDPSQPDTMGVALRVQEGECVYDYAWYSRMSVMEPQSCCFATTSRGLPIHLWDATTGELRATYRGYSDVDEVTAAFSLAFSPDGAKLYGGYGKCILGFDVTRPGRDCRRIPCGTKRSGARLPGMVSCMSFSPDGSALAAGTYAGVIGVFDPRIPEMQLLLSGHKGGLTQVMFTNDGHFLLSGARQDPELMCWDLRGGTGGTGEAASVLYRMQRDTATTNQRVGFSLDHYGRYVATGGCNGAVRVFDLQTGEQVDELEVASDTVTGCDLHPGLNLMAVATGHRRFGEDDMNNADQGTVEPQQAVNENEAAKRTQHSTDRIENALRILRLRQEIVHVPAEEQGAT